MTHKTTPKMLQEQFYVSRTSPQVLLYAYIELQDSQTF